MPVSTEMNLQARTCARVAVVLAAFMLLLGAAGCSGQDARRDGADAREATRPDGSLTEAVADAIAVDDPLVRAARLATVLQAFDESALPDVEAAWDVATGASGAETIELALLVSWWAQYEPDAVFTWLNDRRRTSNPILMKALVRTWAARDPVSAGRSLRSKSLRQDKEFASVYFALAQGWNASGEPGLEDYLMAIPSDANRQIAISGLVIDKVRRGGVEATLEWAENLIDDGVSDFKLRAFRRVAGAVANEDPVRAAEWAESQIAGPWGTGLVRPVAQNWARHDGQAAMEWLRSVPEAPDQARGFEDGYRAWLRNDREAARRWLREQETDPTLDPVVAIYARSTARDDPEEAIPWVARIHHDAARLETLEVVARAWMHHDRDAASAWMATSELSEDAKNRIHEALRKAKERAKNMHERRQRAASGS